MTVQHAAVWIDRKDAKVLHLEPKEFNISKVSAPTPHLSRKAEEQGSHKLHDTFFAEVVTKLEGIDEILIVGPSSTKLDFLRYLHKHQRAMESKVLGVETLDHPSNGQMVAYVRHYFEAKDRQHPRA